MAQKLIFVLLFMAGCKSADKVVYSYPEEELVVTDYLLKECRIYSVVDRRKVIPGPLKYRGPLWVDDHQMVVNGICVEPDQPITIGYRASAFKRVQNWVRDLF